MHRYQSLCLALLFALLLCASALAQNKQNDALFDKGMELYKHQRYEEALTYFRNAHDAGVQRPQSAYYVAVCYQQMGQTQAAHDAFKFVCTKYPASSVANAAFGHMKQLGAELYANQPGSLTAASGKDVRTAFGKGELGNSLRDTAAASAPPSGDYVLKFSEEAMDGRMYVDGAINGKETKMLFDTGSSVMFCRQSFLDKN